ncbi:MAG: hypothetical protein H6581_21315 [Bacteroidia bacterium]|nr:hypothetical protein [Bacteroidia bacterium]
MKTTQILTMLCLLLLANLGCKREISGCTDPLATNYNPDATIDNGTCSYIMGCTDPTAINYNPNATLDDGTCIYQGKVTFWQSGNPSYNVTDVTIGGITRSISLDYAGGIHSCDVSGCANFALSPGTYNYTANEQGFLGTSWSGYVTVTKNGCLLVQLL